MVDAGTCTPGAPTALGAPDVVGLGQGVSPDGTLLLAARVGSALVVQSVSPAGVAAPPVTLPLMGANLTVDRVDWAGDQFVVRAFSEEEGAKAFRVHLDGVLEGSWSEAPFDSGAIAPDPIDGKKRPPAVIFVGGAGAPMALSTECRSYPMSPTISGWVTYYQCLDRALLRWDLETTLAPVGPPVRLNAVGDSALAQPQVATRTQEGIVLTTMTQEFREPTPGLGKHLVVGWSLLIVDGAGVAARTDQATSIDAFLHLHVDLALGEKVMMACESHAGSAAINAVSVPRCRAFSRGGSPLGEVFDGAVSRAFTLATLAPRGCGFVLASTRAMGSDADVRLVLSSLRTDGFSETVSTESGQNYDKLLLAPDGSRRSGTWGKGGFFASTPTCAP
jgi:hypothetical protein